MILLYKGKFGAGYVIRTRDLDVGNVAYLQVNHAFNQITRTLPELKNSILHGFARQLRASSDCTHDSQISLLFRVTGAASRVAGSRGAAQIVRFLGPGAAAQATLSAVTNRLLLILIRTHFSTNTPKGCNKRQVIPTGACERVDRDCLNNQMCSHAVQPAMPGGDLRLTAGKDLHPFSTSEAASWVALKVAPKLELSNQWAGASDLSQSVRFRPSLTTLDRPVGERSLLRPALEPDSVTGNLFPWWTSNGRPTALGIAPALAGEVREELRFHRHFLPTDTSGEEKCTHAGESPAPISTGEVAL